MIRETSKFDRDAAAELINTLRNTEDVALFRGGGLVFTPEEWIEILTGGCGLAPDRRHFDSDWAAAEAAREAGKYGYAPAGATTSPKAAPARQLRDEIWWEVSYQPDKAAAYAHSKTAQPLHTDNAWFSLPAEIDFFIMRKQAVSGGEQTIYPLSRLMEDLQKQEPALLEDLCTVPVVIRKGDHGDFNRTTIIRRDPPGIFWNYYRTQRDSQEISRLCEAFFAFLKKQEDTPSVTKMRCNTGDSFSFNDTRMLHGRTAFEAEAAFDRVLLHSMWKLPAGK